MLPDDSDKGWSMTGEIHLKPIKGLQITKQALNTPGEIHLNNQSITNKSYAIPALLNEYTGDL